LEVFGRSLVAGTAGIETLVIDLDAHVLVRHSEKGAGRAVVQAHLRPPPRCWPIGITAACSTKRSRRCPTAIGTATDPCPGRRCRMRQGVPRPYPVAARAERGLRLQCRFANDFKEKIGVQEVVRICSPERSK
jgi:hypothetical protein